MVSFEVNDNGERPCKARRGLRSQTQLGRSARCLIMAWPPFGPVRSGSSHSVGRLTSKDCGGGGVGIDDAAAGEAEEAARKVACPLFLFVLFSCPPQIQLPSA